MAALFHRVWRLSLRKKPLVKAPPKVSVISIPTSIATVNKCVDNLFETTTCVEKGVVHEKEGQETAPEPTVTKYTSPTKASAFSELSAPVSTSLKASIEEMTESKPASNNVMDEIAGTPQATLETVLSDAPEIEIAQTETSVGILPTAGTVSAAPDLSPAGNSSTEATPTPGNVEIILAPKDATSTTEAVTVSEVFTTLDLKVFTTLFYYAPVEKSDGPDAKHRMHAALPTSEVKVTQTQSISPEIAATGAIVDVTSTTVQDVSRLQSSLPPETPIDPAYTSSSSEIPFKEETVTHKITPEASDSLYKLGIAEPKASPVVPNKDTAIQEVPLEEVMSSMDVAPEKAIISDFIARVRPAKEPYQPGTVGTLVVPASQTGEIVALTEKGPDVAPEPSSIIWNHKSMKRLDPANAELAEKRKTEGEEGVEESLDAQLDPIQRLFPYKIRDYFAKSKACDGPVDDGPEYKKAFSEELAKLQRLYGNGDLTSFPEFKFSEPVLDEISSK